MGAVTGSAGQAPRRMARAAQRITAYSSAPISTRRATPERDHSRNTAPGYPRYPVPGSGRTGQAGTDNPVLEPGEHGLSRVGLEVLPDHQQGCNRREPCSGHRYQGGQGIVLPVDGADIGGG